MDTYRARGNSPPRYRPRYDDPRASTGTMISSSLEPTRYTHRASLDPSRPSNFGYEAHPVARKTYVDSGVGGGTTSRTEYAVRPRKDSSTTGENRRPVSTLLSPTSPMRSRPVIPNLNIDPRDLRDPRDRPERPRSPLSRPNRPRDDAPGHLYLGAPAPARNHQRHHSATPAEMDRLQVARRDGRERSGYHGTGESRQSTYPVTRPPLRIAEEEAYSYTGPREQFARDYPSKPPPRRDSHTRGERPTSVMGPPEWKPPRRDPREIAAPPSASRQLERIDRADPPRLNVRTGHESDSDRGLNPPRRRNSTRTPVLHQTRNDDYVPQKDDFEKRRVPKQARDRYDDDSRQARDRDYDKPERHADPRRIPRSRDSSPERPGLSKGMAAVGLGGIAVAGLAGARSQDNRSKDDESDSEERKERRRRKHRTRDVEEPELAGGERVSREKYDEDYDDRNRPTERRERAKEDRNGEDATDDGQKRHRHRRRRHRHQAENGQDVVSESGSDRPIPYPTRDDMNLPKENGRINSRDMVESDLDELDTNSPYHSRDLPLVDSQPRTLSPGEDEDDRPRRVTLVEPPKEDERPKPRGILKPARAVPFPEDPNPTREGVAPLKEAGKQGVPPGARWTKINRLLVNPEALEKSHERFEERDDYVIVLRVLTKEEINKLAEKTHEIREAREREWQERKSKSRDHSRGEYPSDEEEGRKAPLTIEAPPQNSGAEQWLGQLQGADSLGRSVPAAEVPVPVMANLDLAAENYSTNV